MATSQRRRARTAPRTAINNCDGSLPAPPTATSPPRRAFPASRTAPPTAAGSHSRAIGSNATATGCRTPTRAVRPPARSAKTATPPATPPPRSARKPRGQPLPARPRRCRRHRGVREFDRHRQRREYDGRQSGIDRHSIEHLPIAGITSAASLAAQSGPTSFVTTDAAGNLAAASFSPDRTSRSCSPTSRRCRRRCSRRSRGRRWRSPWAAAPASDKRFAISSNWGTFRGRMP